MLASAALVASTTTADASRARLLGWDPHWFAQGRLIAFYGVKSRPSRSTSGARLWLMNADGSGRRPLSGDGLSPSGRRLATAGDTGTAGIVGITSLSGKRIRKFTIHVVADLGYGPVEWAPDERAVTVGLDDAMIFVADLRTGLVRSVSHVRSRDDERAAWSPDSRHIAFISCAKHGSNCNLALIGRSGSGRRVLVRNIGDANTNDVRPVWAPNGRAIAFAMQFGKTRFRPPTRETSGEEQRYGIYVVKPDGSALRRVAATRYWDRDSSVPALAWSPNSRRIAFGTVGTSEITISDIRDGSRHRLTLRFADPFSWAPSTRILFSNGMNVYTVLPGRRPLRILP
jgi:WD40 repeat protein